ncbi:unnamed protein product [Bemisia tabaci]|uniref:Uncharacterized protein n=1 Tax=Bemisia tabaci TaxID=7038 RepID=A0A9P0A2U0_BEMTA|nr:PREDICTED: uncharacterized protein LOC109032515 [Bemisia tabaci]CAH0384569.1 unnamed protein product [Bemisia tabaci]
MSKSPSKSFSEETINPMHILQRVNELLRNNVFKGTFRERRNIPFLNGPRDVIVIHQSEKEFLKKARVAIRILKPLERYKDSFIGITEKECEGSGESEILLWIPPAHEQPFGDYLFFMPGIVANEAEVGVSVLFTRRLEANELEIPDYNEDEPLAEILKKRIAVLSRHFTEFLLEVFTYTNFKLAVQFLSALLLTICVTLGNFTYCFGEFLLKFMREVSIFTEAATPILFGCLHVINNAVYGLYTLILCLFKSNSAPFRAPPPPDQSATLRWKNERMKAMQYRR